MASSGVRRLQIAQATAEEREKKKKKKSKRSTKSGDYLKSIGL